MRQKSCMHEMPYEIVEKGLNPVQSSKIIKQLSDKVYYVPSGYNLNSMVLIGSDKIPVGTQGTNIIFQFIKPCFGIFILKIKDAKEAIEQLEKDFGENFA